MLRYVKYAVLSVLTVIVGGVLLFGANFSSYVRTSAHSVQDAVKESVPVEFELRRARDLIEAILPELQAQVRMIAQEEVEIAALETDIRNNVSRLESERETLARLRETMHVQQVSYSIGNRELSRSQLTEQLHQRFQRFKQGQLAVNSKERLLEQRQKSLDAALAMLEKTRHRKAELAQKVEALAAENRLVKASKIEAGNKIDGSRLSEADQLLTQIQTRLDVAQRVLAHEQDIYSSDPDGEIVIDWVDEQHVLSEIDAYFDNGDTNGETSEVVSRLAGS
jgi:hypothetical protein